MCAIDVAEGEVIAQARPRRLLDEDEIEPGLCGEALFAGRDEHGAVDERHERRDDPLTH